MPSIPVFTAAAAALLGVERVAGRRLVGIPLAAAGALVLLDPARLETSPRATLGNLLILANCLCYALFLVLQRPLLARLPWRTLIAWCFLFGSLGTLLLSAPALVSTPWSALPASTLLGILYIGLLPTAGAFALNTWAVRRSSPALAAAFTTLQPVLTGALAAFALRESLRGHQAAGFALIVAGLFLVQAAAVPAPPAARRRSPEPGRGSSGPPWRTKRRRSAAGGRPARGRGTWSAPAGPASQCAKPSSRA